MARAPHLTETRRLLARLRDVMADEGSAQERLNSIVQIIATDLVAEVCSVYVLRAGEVLELFAATGLHPDAIHRTRLHIGEGLIGAIATTARPMALEDAQNHPAFAYRPETGEEIFQSLAGVPILRGGRVSGVLAVQNQTKRRYLDEELETLETIAMVIAELIAGGDLINADEQNAVDGEGILPVTLEGVRLNGGLAIGRAVRHEQRVTIVKLIGENPDEEMTRLETAIAEMHGAIDELLESDHLSGGGESREILQAYRMFAEDAGWISRIREAIGAGLSAEAAVERVRNDTRARFRKQTDPYLRERLHDFNDLARRLLQHLVGKSTADELETQPDDMVLIAREMGPAELLDYDRSKLQGLVLEGGSVTTHVAIVARALDIPAVGRAEDALDKVENLDTIIIDGDNAKVFVRPSEEVQDSYTDKIRSRAQRVATYASLRDVPAETRDGLLINLDINAGLVAEVSQLAETGADGIGLYRTEIPFMDSTNFPDVDRQAEIYGQILDSADGKPVIFRTLDIGGDKGLPYWDHGREENPAMGWRAIRIALDRPTLMKHQIRAMIRAATGRELSVMFPMISEIPEFDQARKLLDHELERAAGKGRDLPSRIRVGSMLEVPALLYQLPALLSRVDFVSVGSNDLFQFLFASDRGSPKLADRYDTLAPPVLAMLRNLVEVCDAAGKTVSLCGEMAGRPLDAMALVGLGFRRLSMTPSSIGPVKAMIRSLSVNDLSQYLQGLDGSAEHSLREKLREFAVDHGVMI